MSEANLKELGLSVIHSLNEIEELKHIPDFHEQLRFFQNRFEDDEFRIAVVGEYSTGKSTFLNAIIGKDVLGHATRETTAAVTRVVNVSADDPRCGTGRVAFYEHPDINMDDLGNLAKYTTTRSTFCDVAAEVESVEICCPILGNDANVVFVDTPGLNGIADGHYERTVELVRQAHTCIYLLHLHGLKETDKAFIRMISQYQKHFIFVLNCIDELKASEGDDLEQILIQQAKILRETVFQDSQHIHFDICGISALHALVYVDHDIVRLYSNDIGILTDEARAALLHSSNFPAFRGILDRTLTEESRQQIKYEDTAIALWNWLDYLRSDTQPRVEYYRDIFQSSKEGRNVSNYEKRKANLLLRQEERKQNLCDHILASSERHQREEADMLEESLSAVFDQVSTKIATFNEILCLEQWSRDVSSHLCGSINPIITEHRQRIQWYQIELYQRLIQRIKDYTDTICHDTDVADLPLSTPEKPQVFMELDDRVEQAERDLAAAVIRKEEAEQLAVTALRRQNAARAAYDEAEADISILDQSYSQQLSQIGSRPAPVSRRVSYTAEEWRGGFGILDSLFGPKKVTRYKNVTDDSLGQKWDSEKIKISNRYHKELVKLKRRSDNEHREYEHRKIEYSEAQNTRRVREAELQQQRKIHDANVEKINQEKKYAEQEYLKAFKDSLCQQIKQYLLGADNGVLHQLNQNMAETFKQIVPIFEKIAIDHYESAMKQRIEELDAAIAQNTPQLRLQLQSITYAAGRLDQLYREMEENLSVKSV
jgi:GTP-binding protein EngB required for normal cell division